MFKKFIVPVLLCSFAYLGLTQEAYASLFSDDKKSSEELWEQYQGITSTCNYEIADINSVTNSGESFFEHNPNPDTSYVTNAYR